MGWTPPSNAASRYHRGWVGSGRTEMIGHLVVAIDRHEDRLRRWNSEPERPGRTCSEVVHPEPRLRQKGGKATHPGGH